MLDTISSYANQIDNELPIPLSSKPTDISTPSDAAADAISALLHRLNLPTSLATKQSPRAELGKAITSLDIESDTYLLGLQREIRSLTARRTGMLDALVDRTRIAEAEQGERSKAIAAIDKLDGQIATLRAKVDEVLNQPQL